MIRHGMKQLTGFVLMVCLLALIGCNKPHSNGSDDYNEYHPTGFDGDLLYINIDGKTLCYERYERGIGSFTKKDVLDSFNTETEIEGIVWAVYSTEESPDLEYVLVISGTNSSWTYRKTSDLQSGETELQKISYEGPLSCVTHHSGWGRMSLMDMTEEFHKKVLAMLNDGIWLNDVTKCESDYEFETKNEEIRYHSECGTFIDVTNKRSLQLSDEEQAEINRMLGAK